MVKSALIIGVTGQDGSYLAFKLLKKVYKIFVTIRSKAFQMASLNPEEFIIFDKSLKRPSDLESIYLDPKLIETELNWKAKTDFNDIVEKMYLEEYF